MMSFVFPSQVLVVSARASGPVNEPRLAATSHDPSVFLTMDDWPGLSRFASSNDRTSSGCPWSAEVTAKSLAMDRWVAS